MNQRPIRPHAMRLRLRPLLLTLFVLIHAMHFVLAQSGSKLPLQLNAIAKESHRSNELIPFLVKGNLGQIRMLTEELGGVYKFGHGNIASVALPAGALHTFSRSMDVQKIENSRTGVRQLMDESIHSNNVDSVHQGLGDLPSGYTGKNVVLGIIDVGVYFDHPDFQKEDGSTRIRYIWDQPVPNPNKSPLPYNYGQEWSKQDIDDGQCTHIEPSNGFSHGTNVTGIAAGDGSALDKFKGVAPDAELIIVALDFNDFLTNVVDAIDYIFKKADAMGKPCVINTSVGTYYGSHDGKDLHAQLIDALLEERSGRAVVAAGGNAGHIPYHLGYEVEPDSLFTWFYETTPSTSIYYEIYADTNDFDQVEFYMSADHPTLYYTFGRTAWMNIRTDLDVGPGQPDQIMRSIQDDSSNLVGQVWIRAEEDLGVYKLEVEIVPVVDYLNWRLATRGSGRFDVWSAKGVTGTSNIFMGPLPTPAQLPEIDRYKQPDHLKTIVSSWQCSEKVITVANYTNRIEYLDYDSNWHNVNSESGAFPSTPGDLFPTSSLGPSRDNKVKPDLAAAGSATLATANLTNAALLIGSNQGYKVAAGGMHNRNGGTSMASPVVAGIVALYFEQNPNADWNEVKQVLIQTAKEDSLTGPTPNAGWGNGKVNAFRALGFDAVLGCMDTAALNYDVQVNIDNGDCTYPVYGCTDPLASNYDPEANTDDSSCLFLTTSVAELLDDQLTIYPNPVRDQLHISISGNAKSFPLLLSVFNYNGQNIHEILIERHADLKSIQLPESIENGIYQVQLLTDDYRYFERIVVLK